MDQDSGILRRSLLSLRKELTQYFELTYTAAYKHFLIIFGHSENQDGQDCVVFDTKKGTTYNLQTGLETQKRKGFFFSYWKDNIFVFYGGVFQASDELDTGYLRKLEPDMNLYFLYLNENEEKISFTVESCHLTDREWWDKECWAHISQDQMYIFGSSNNYIHYGVLSKFDLNRKTWSRCQTTGDIPKDFSGQTTVLFNDKIYFLTKDRNVQDMPAGGGGGLFGSKAPTAGAGGLFGNGGSGGSGLFNNSARTGSGAGSGSLVGGQARTTEEEPQKALDLFVLDLESMKWRQIHKDNFLPTSVQNGFRAEAVGDKIYIFHESLDEFFIYDPANGKVSKSEGFPGKENWRIKSFKNHSILFRIDLQPNSICIEYQNLVTSGHPEQQEGRCLLSDPLVQLPYMEYIWKEKPFADITFVAENEEIQAHRAILLKCRYFQNMFKSGMIETTSNKINVPDISSVNFKAILEYIYCDKIALTESSAMELIILADMYSLPNLKSDCEKYLSEKLTVGNFVEVMKVAQTADSEKLEKRVVNFLTSNIEKVKQEVDVNAIPPELFIKAIMHLKPTKKGN